MPFSQHERWKEIYGQAKEAKELRPIVEALYERGIYGAEQADKLIEQAKHLENLSTGMAENPVNVAFFWKKQHPEAFNQVASTIVADTVREMIAGQRQAGDEEAAAVLERVFADWGAQTSAGRQPQQPRPDGREQQIREREQRAEQSEMRAARDLVRRDVEQTLLGKLEPLISKVPFRESGFLSRVRFLEELFDRYGAEAAKDVLFTGQLAQLWQRGDNGYTDDQIGRIAKAHVERADRGGRLVQLAQGVLQEMGLALVKQNQAETQRLQQLAQGHREPGGGTALAAGGVDSDVGKAVQEAGGDCSAVLRKSFGAE